MRAPSALCSLLLCSALGVAAPTEASAQPSSAPALHVLVPLPAGGTSDVVARLFARSLEGLLAQPVVIDNRPGASGRVAVAALKIAPADGTTVLFAPMIIPVLGPLTFRNRTYDPVTDLVPIAQVSTYDLALAVAASHPARTLAEFVEGSRKDALHAQIGNTGAGSLPHFLGVGLARASGVDFVQVPYPGTGAMAAAMLGGHVGAGISALPDFLALHSSGRVRILATSGARRSPVVPGVPTFREAGYGELTASGWHGLFAPKGTPPAIIDRLSKAVATVLAQPQTRAKLMEMSLDPTGSTPQALAAIMAADTAYWRPIIEASGFSTD